MNNCDLTEKEEQVQVDAIRANLGLSPQDFQIVSFRLHWPDGMPDGTLERIDALDAAHDSALVRRVMGNSVCQIYTEQAKPTNDWEIHLFADAFQKSGLTAKDIHRELQSVVH